MPDELTRPKALASRYDLAEINGVGIREIDFPYRKLGTTWKVGDSEPVISVRRTVAG